MCGACLACEADFWAVVMLEPQASSGRLSLSPCERSVGVLEYRSVALSRICVPRLRDWECFPGFASNAGSHDKPDLKERAFLFFLSKGDYDFRTIMASLSAILTSSGSEPAPIFSIT